MNMKLLKNQVNWSLQIFFQNLLKNGKYLGEYTKEYEKQDRHSSSLYLARVVRYREPFIKEAIRNTLLVFLSPEEF